MSKETNQESKKKTKIRSDQSKKARNKSERRKEFRLRADYLHDEVFT